MYCCAIPKDEGRIKRSCQTIVVHHFILPQACHVTDGLRFVATQELLTFAVICPKEEKKTTHKNPPIGMIKLYMSCTDKSKYLSLLLYCHNESKTDIQDLFVHGLSLYNDSTFKWWELFITSVPNFPKTYIHNELKDTKEISIRHLLMSIYKMKKIALFGCYFDFDNNGTCFDYNYILSLQEIFCQNISQVS